MTRKECEEKIIEKLLEIWDIAQEYRPKQKHHLNMSVGVDHASCFRIISHKDGDPLFDIDVFRRIGMHKVTK